MLFTPENVQLILKGRKTQTRRIVKQGETPRVFDPLNMKIMGIYISKVVRELPEYIYSSDMIVEQLWRPKWVRRHTYAVQPGRGKKAVARIRITEIRRERLQDITWNDVKAEGIPGYTFARGCLADNPPDPRWKYIELWDSIHKRKCERWADNPLVWALSFELVKED